MRLWRRASTAERPLSCREVARVLQHYLDGEIDERVATRVAEHLEDCRRCGLEVEVYEEIKAALARQAPDVPTAAVERLRRFGERLAGDGAPGDGTERPGGD
jgi:anti-sigma factor (TIGR02949 family)